MRKIGLSLDDNLVYEVRCFCKKSSMTVSGFFSAAAIAYLQAEALKPSFQDMLDKLQSAQDELLARQAEVELQTSLYEKKPTRKR